MKLGQLVISRNIHRALGASLLGGLFACSGSAPGPESAPPPSDANAVVEAEAGLSVQGVLHVAGGGPAADVTVCLRTDPLVAGQGPCTTSDVSGAFSIANVPTNSFVAITFEKAAFVPTLRPIATATSDVTLPVGDGELETSDAFAARTGRALDASTAAIAFLTSIPGSLPAVAATASLRPVDGPPGLAPRYDGALADAGAGTSGVFTSVSGGYYVLTLSAASVSCAPAGGLYGFPVTVDATPGEARVLVPAVAGFVTTPVVAVCSTTAVGE